MRPNRLVPLLLLAGLASCDILSPKQVDYRQRAIDEVVRREALWTAMNIHSYDMDYVRDCTPCSAVATQPVQIRVRDDVITHVLDNQGGEVAPVTGIPWPTVDSLFRWTHQLLDDVRFAVEIEFDTVQNFPKHVRGEDPGRSLAEHNSSNFVIQTSSAPVVQTSSAPVVQTESAPVVARYLIGTPFSKSNRVTWRNR